MPNPRIQVEIDADTKKFGAGFEKAASMVRNFLTVGAIAGAAKAAIELGSRISDLSARAQVSAKWLQEVGYAAKMAGSSMEEVASSVQELTRAQVQALSGSGADMNAFRALGISAEELRAQNPEQLFDTVARNLVRSGKAAEQVNAALAVMGRTGKALVGALGEEFDGARSKASELGIVLSDDTVQAMDELGDRLDTLKVGFTAFSALVLRNVMSLSNWVAVAKLAIQTLSVGSRFSAGGAMMAYLQGGWSGVASNVALGLSEISNTISSYESGRAKEDEEWAGLAKRRRGPGDIRGKSGSISGVAADALQRIGIYVGGSGSTGASLLNVQRQALTELRLMNQALRRPQARPGRFEQ